MILGNNLREFLYGNIWFCIPIGVTDKAIKSIAKRLGIHHWLVQSLSQRKSFLDHLQFIYHSSGSHRVFIALECSIRPLRLEDGSLFSYLNEQMENFRLLDFRLLLSPHSSQQDPRYESQGRKQAPLRRTIFL